MRDISLWFPFVQYNSLQTKYWNIFYINVYICEKFMLAIIANKNFA